MRDFHDVQESLTFLRSICEEVNPPKEAGKKVSRGFDPDGSRYLFDGTLLAVGWKQYDTDQDAWYFGMWYHPEIMATFCYCEGDLILVECATEDAWGKELAEMSDLYGAPPPAFVVIDASGVTEVFDSNSRP